MNSVCRILECLEGEKLSYERVYVCDRSPCRQLFALASWDSGGRGPRMAYHYTSGGGGRRGRLPVAMLIAKGFRNFKCS